jgi:YegS/Rv2252/BmrU family lipid kinase
MTRSVKVILNPTGGRLTGNAKVSKVEQALQYARLDYDLELTQHPKHGTELARQAALDGWPIIVAVGGDGTVNEVVNGIIEADISEPRPVLGIIPMGTANDLADMLQLPRDVNEACQRIATGEAKWMDVGQVNGHYFVNNSAVGLEPVVTLTQDKMRWIKGAARYILAAIKTILKAKHWNMRIDWPGGSFEGAVVLVSVGNSSRTGGLFFMTPDAKIDDGLLDFVYGVKMSRWRMFLLLPRILFGTHVNHHLVVYRKTQSLKITASPPTPIQADGEIIDTVATEIQYQIIPNKLQIIV